MQSLPRLTRFLPKTEVVQMHAAVQMHAPSTCSHGTALPMRGAAAGESFGERLLLFTHIDTHIFGCG